MFYIKGLVFKLILSQSPASQKLDFGFRPKRILRVTKKVKKMNNQLMMLCIFGVVGCLLFATDSAMANPGNDDELSVPEREVSLFEWFFLNACESFGNIFALFCMKFGRENAQIIRKSIRDVKSFSI